MARHSTRKLVAKGVRSRAEGGSLKIVSLLGKPGVEVAKPAAEPEASIRSRTTWTRQPRDSHGRFLPLSDPEVQAAIREMSGPAPSYKPIHNRFYAIWMVGSFLGMAGIAWVFHHFKL